MATLHMQLDCPVSKSPLGPSTPRYIREMPPNAPPKPPEHIAVPPLSFRMQTSSRPMRWSSRRPPKRSSSASSGWRPAPVPRSRTAFMSTATCSACSPACAAGSCPRTRSFARAGPLRRSSDWQGRDVLRSGTPPGTSDATGNPRENGQNRWETGENGWETGSGGSGCSAVCPVGTFAGSLAAPDRGAPSTAFHRPSVDPQNAARPVGVAPQPRGLFGGVPPTDPPPPVPMAGGPVPHHRPPPPHKKKGLGRCQASPAPPPPAMCVRLPTTRGRAVVTPPPPPPPKHTHTCVVARLQSGLWCIGHGADCAKDEVE